MKKTDQLIKELKEFRKNSISYNDIIENNINPCSFVDMDRIYDAVVDNILEQLLNISLPSTTFDFEVEIDDEDYKYDFHVEIINNIINKLPSGKNVKLWHNDRLHEYLSKYVKTNIRPAIHMTLDFNPTMTVDIDNNFDELVTIVEKELR